VFQEVKQKIKVAQFFLRHGVDVQYMYARVMCFRLDRVSRWNVE